MNEIKNDLNDNFTVYDAENESSMVNDFQNIREELVNIAVNFLLNPKVQTTSLNQKRNFLLSKGLNNYEIDLAIDKTLSRFTLNNLNEFDLDQLQTRNFFYHKNPTFLSVVRSVTSLFLLSTGVCYTFYMCYNKFLKPLIYGKNECKTSLDLVREELNEFRKSLNCMKDDLSKLDQNMKKNIELELYSSKQPNAAEIAAINDLKSEMSTIKSLMLNKNQFPIKTNQNTATIPSWQLPSQEDSTEEIETEVNGI